MSDHGTHHEENTGKIKSKTSFVSSFWVILILAGMFIAALNFIQAMGGEVGRSNGNEGTEQMSSGTEHQESGPVSPLQDTTSKTHEPAAPAAPAEGHH